MTEIQALSAPRTARQVAFVVLDHYRRTKEFVAAKLLNETARASLSPADQRLARELVLGVIRRQATLEALIQPHVNRPRDRIEDPLWTLLQLGAYELAFLSGIPPRASVYETTELARFLNQPRWTGFLNGVLRAVARNLTGENTETPAANAFPLAGGGYRPCALASFPDPGTDPAGYFAAAFSFPLWLATRWQGRFASEDLPRLGFWFNTVSPFYLRVNPLRTTRAALLERFAAENVAAEPAELNEAILMPDTRSVGELPGFAEGQFSVQDLTAMKAVALLDPQPGETILDLCAAPGTKTTAIAERMQNEGRVIATDVNPSRLLMIEENTERLGIEMIELVQIAHDGSDLPRGPFDAVLVDAPCSNTGVLGKRVEARWRLGPNDLQELSAIQRRLLTAACDRLKPGGRIVYSTCSIEPEENEDVLHAAQTLCPNCHVVQQQTHLPGQPSDGGFSALLRRNG